MIFVMLSPLLIIDLSHYLLWKKENVRKKRNIKKMNLNKKKNKMSNPNDNNDHDAK